MLRGSRGPGELAAVVPKRAGPSPPRSPRKSVVTQLNRTWRHAKDPQVRDFLGLCRDGRLKM